MTELEILIDRLVLDGAYEDQVCVEVMDAFDESWCSCNCLYDKPNEECYKKWIETMMTENNENERN